MPNILHLSLAHGGGVVTSIESYIVNGPPNARHFLLAKLPKSPAGSDVTFDAFVDHDLVENFFQVPKKLRSFVSSAKIDIVHLHSSFAGLIGRLTPLSARKIYTPHCYGFERTDLNSLAKTFFKLVEGGLRFHPCEIAACGPRERAAAIALGHPPDAVHETFNYAEVEAPSIKVANSRPKVVMVGRLCAQKAPGLFGEIASLARCEMLDQTPDFVWCGDGDSVARQRLDEVGVQVTGWLPRQEVLGLLAQADLYLHTAAWEGNPMSLLEAAALRVPILARNIDAVTSLGIDAVFSTSSDASRLVAEFFGNTYKAPHEQWKAINAVCSKEALQRTLRELYA